MKKIWVQNTVRIFEQAKTRWRENRAHGCSEMDKLDDEFEKLPPVRAENDY